MKKALAILFLFAGVASAQTIPHVTGTFKTPEGKTPSQAGLRSIATINAVPVYGSVDFQPYDSSGNKPTRILCGGITYIPQRVRGWIAGDGTLVDNYTAAAGVSLVPNAGCTPTGLVTRAFITLAATADGRVQSVTWTEDKTLPQQASADWGALAAAGITAPTYIGYATIENGGVALPARSILNFLTGSCTDNAATLATDCPSGGGGGGPTVQTAGVNNSSQTILNFQTGAAANGLSIAPTNPSGGNEQFALSGTLTDAGLASAYSGVGSCGANQFANTFTRNAAPGCAQVGYAQLSGAPQLAQTLANASHKWLNSYTASTGLFTQTQPDYSDLTGVPSTFAPSAHNLLSTAHGDTAAHSVLRGDIIAGIGASPAWTAVAKGGTNSYPKWNASGDVVPSTNPASGTGACGANQFETGDNADAAPSCAQVAYAGISGTPTLFYQTLQNASGADQTQRGKVEFTGSAVASVVDDSANNRTVVTLTASAGSGVTLQTNGVNDSSQTALNLKNSAATNGLTLTQTNTAGGDVQLGLSGTLTVPGGGTGLGTLSAHQLYVGNGTSAPNAVGAGNAGQVLISNGGSSDPTFQDPIVSWNNGTAVTAAWTSATSVDAAATAALTAPNMSLVTVTLRATSTMTGGTLNFEADDGSGNFSFPVSCDRLDTANVETSFALAVTNKAWLCSVAGFSNFRVRLNPAITGTGTANIRVTATTSPTPSEMTVQQANGASLHVNVDSAPTTAVTGTFWQATQPVSGTVTANAGTGTFNIQANASVNVAQINGVTPLMGNGVTGTGSQRVTIASDNTAFGVNANQAGIWTVQPGNTANTTAWLTTDSADMSGTTPGTAPSKTGVVGGIFNSSAPTPSTGQTLPLQLDSSGNLKVNIQAGAGSGGTALADTAAFTQGTTSLTPIGGEFTSSPTTLTSGQAGVARLTSDRMLMDDLEKIGGAAFAQGQRTLANSVSIVPASDYSSPDTVGSSTALNAGNAAASVATNAQQGSGMFLAAGTLAGTVVPEVSYDGGTTWATSSFYDPNARTFSQSLVLTNPNAATSLTVLVPGGATNARARVSSYTSGTATATMRATLAREIIPATQPISAASLPLPAGAALDASVTGLEVAQASTTSGQKGNLGLCAVTTSSPSYTTAQTDPCSLDTSGNLRVAVTNTPTVTANAGTGNFQIQPVPSSASANALTGCYLQSAATTNATNCKASSGNFYGVRAINTTATIYYLRMYNTSAAPTCSSATGFIESIPVPANASGAGFAFLQPYPINYSTGVSFCFTGGGSSTDNTSAATGVYISVLYQ